MQVRRRWNVMVLAPVALFFVTTAAAVGAPPVPADQAADKLKDAKGSEANDIQLSVVKSAPTGAKDLDEYYKSLWIAFQKDKLLESANTDAQLNAAMILAKLSTVDADAPLEEMLTNKSAAVRYWGAKGLALNGKDLAKFGGTTTSTALKDLDEALGKETSGIVKKQMASALVSFGDIDALLEGLQSLDTAFANGFPDRESLDAASELLGYLNQVAGGKVAGVTLTAKQKTAAAEAAGWAASLAIHQETNKAADERPKDYNASVSRTINNSLALLNTLAGKILSTPIKGGSDDTALAEIAFRIDSIVGTSGTGPGTIQSIFPDVKVPPAVKMPAK